MQTTLSSQQACETPRVLTDAQIVERVKAGDRVAFDGLVRRYHARVYRLTVHMLRDREEAEDVTQETFVRAFQAIGGFDGRSEPFTWIYRIAVNLSLNVLRSRKHQRITVDPSDPRLDGLEVAGDQADHAARRQLYLCLCRGLDGLSETLKTTMILVAVDGCSHEAAALVLGAPEGTIAWRVHEARRKLREHLSAHGFDVGGEGL